MGEYTVCTKVVGDRSQEMVHSDEDSMDHTRDSLLKVGPINESAVPFTKQKII